MSKKPKTPRPIPPERCCFICGKPVKFTHSRTTKQGLTKQRHCPFCNRVDRVLLRIEVVKIIEVARKSVRTNTPAKKVRRNRSKVCEPTHIQG
jgi:hypothetical protein